MYNKKKILDSVFVKPTFSDETKSHTPKLCSNDVWCYTKTITVYPVDDAIGFQILPVVEGIMLAKNKAATVFILLFLINV